MEHHGNFKFNFTKLSSKIAYFFLLADSKYVSYCYDLNAFTAVTHSGYLNVESLSFDSIQSK